MLIWYLYYCIYETFVYADTSSTTKQSTYVSYLLYIYVIPSYDTFLDFNQQQIEPVYVFAQLISHIMLIYDNINNIK